MLLENPRGDNRLDLDKLKKISSIVFATNNAQLRFFSGGTGEFGNNCHRPVLFSWIKSPMTRQHLFFFFFFFVRIYILTTELTNKMDLQALNGKTLTVTQGSSSPGPAPTTSGLLCPYVNLLLCNAQPSGEKHVKSKQFRPYLQTIFLEV